MLKAVDNPDEVILYDEKARLVRESSREKSERYVCTACNGVCYYPHSKTEIPYKYCPNCGRSVNRD